MGGLCLRGTLTYLVFLPKKKLFPKPDNCGIFGADLGISPEIGHKSSAGMTQRLLRSGAQWRGGVVCINTPFALLHTKETLRKIAPKLLRHGSPLFLLPVSLVRDKERAKLERDEILNTNGCQVPDEQMSKWWMLKSVVNIVAFSFFLFFFSAPPALASETYVVNPRSSSLRPH